MMHEDSPKMSVTQGLNASMSQPKSDMVLDGTVEYEMSSTEAKPSENIQMDLKIAYADPLNDNTIRIRVHLDLLLSINLFWDMRPLDAPSDLAGPKAVPLSLGNCVSVSVGRASSAAVPPSPPPGPPPPQHLTLPLPPHQGP
ncbi:unnamed protein product [Danaus chrysippus]|uniref:(African queen) hypothetical protein n=1 Tax=Danaus chrysippus TaxID=151541 RepID=A0A8J2Q7T7_9NEOP|nr:unnamed protein product [Danaus chrysippus]